MPFSELTDLQSAISDACEQVRNSPADPGVVSEVLHAFIMRAWDLPPTARDDLLLGLSGQETDFETYLRIRDHKRKTRRGEE